MYQRALIGAPPAQHEPEGVPRAARAADAVAPRRVGAEGAPPGPRGPPEAKKKKEEAIYAWGTYARKPLDKSAFRTFRLLP